VLMGAHIDSWDLGQGATDDGFGSAALLGAAEAIVKAGGIPERTIRFVFFSGEEQGIQGSRTHRKACGRDGEPHGRGDGGYGYGTALFPAAERARGSGECARKGSAADVARQAAASERF